MEHNKEPKLSLLLALVHPLDGEEGQGKAEGGDEVDRLLLDRALAEFGRTEDTIAGHQGEMDEEKEPKNRAFVLMSAVTLSNPSLKCFWNSS